MSMTNALTIFARDGKALVNSRDVATKTGKRHDNLLRDIDNLLKSLTPSDLSWFIETSYIDEKDEKRRSFDMTKDGFALLAMGWNGAKWIMTKIQWIEQFNLMEAELKRLAQREPYTAPLSREERLRIGYLALQEINEEQTKQIEELTPDAIAQRRQAASEGSMCPREAAKRLDCAERKFFQWLRSIGWIYKNSYDSDHPWLAYASIQKQGYMEHTYNTKRDANGNDHTYTQALITAKGFDKLSKMLPQALCFRNRRPSNGQSHDNATLF